MNQHMKYFFLLSAAAATLMTACSTAEKNGDAAAQTPAPAAAATVVYHNLETTFAKADAARAKQQSVKDPELTPEQAKYDAAFRTKVNTARAAYQKSLSDADAKALLALADDIKASDAVRSMVFFDKAQIDINRKPEQAPASIRAALDFKPALASNFRARLYQQLADIRERQKDWTGAGNARLRRLAENMPDNKPIDIFRQKINIIQLFSRAEGSRGAAVSLAGELAADQTLDPEMKRNIWNLLVDVGGNDPEMLKQNTAFLMTHISDPACTNAMNNVFRRMQQAKMSKEYTELRDRILNDENAEMSLRIAWFREKGNQIRNNQWSNKRRFFYLLGNTLLRNDKRNPFYGKELIADAGKEVRARQGEDLYWIADALKDLKMEPKAYVDLLNYVRGSASLGGDRMVQELARMVTEVKDAPDNRKVDAFSTLINLEIGKGDFKAAEQIADRAEKLNITIQQDESAYAVVHSFKARILMMQKDRPDEAAAYLRKQIDGGAKNRRMYDQLAKVYQTFLRWDDELKVRQEQGELGAVLKLTAQREPEKAKAMALDYMESLKNDPKSLSFRASCMSYFMPTDYGLGGLSDADRAVRAKYPELVKELGHWNAGAYISGARRAITFSRFRTTLEMTALWKARDPKANYERSEMEVQSYAALGDKAGLQALIKEVSEEKDFNAYQKARLMFTAGAATLPDQKGELKKFWQNFRFPDGITDQQCSGILLQAGIVAMNGKLYTIADEAYQVRQSLYKPEPQKLYEIKFSDQQILGLEGFRLHAGTAEKQKMDRKFGGNMDFLTTDVSTGSRAGGIGTDKASETQYVEFQAACDENGIHFVFTANDDKTPEIIAGTVGAGSFEMYLAPGEDQPYFCFLPNLTTGGFDIWDSTYRNKQWRRLSFSQNGQDIRMERIFTDNGCVLYMFLSWEPFYDKLPEAGDKWDFENVYWSRFGGYSWNGIKTIHGRSTWGKLTFRISPEQMLKIKQKIIYSAKRKYQAEKSTTAAIHGVIDRWSRDNVLGDPKFYVERVAPVVNELDSKLGDVKAVMTPETINDLYRSCVPGWFEIRYVIGDLRRQYLEDSFSKE